MALFFECAPQCAGKLLDPADIVRDAWLQHLAAHFPQADLAPECSRVAGWSGPVERRSRLSSVFC
jgi:hypothetical protein